MKTIEEKAIEIAKLIQDGKARNTVLIDVSEISSWTDYFVIATVTSSAHLQGLSKDIKDYVKDNDLEIHLTNKKSPDGADWNLIDIGPIVVHLMTETAREFYDLENLWYAGRKIEF